MRVPYRFARKPLLLTLLLPLLSASLHAQPIGNTYIAGTTWWDLQRMNSCNRQIGVDDSGYVYVAWTKSVTSNVDSRNTYYNKWSRLLQQFVLTSDGEQVNPGIEAGSPDVDVIPNSCALLSFVYMSNITSYHLRILPCPPGEPPLIPDEYGSLAYPVSAYDIIGHVHTLVLKGDFAQEPPVVWYGRGMIMADEFGQPSEIQWDDAFELLDTLSSPNFTIAASRNSERVARGYLKPTNSFEANEGSPLICDVFFQFSADTGHTWSQRINVTNFAPPDTIWSDSVSWHYQDRDTLRAAYDLSLLFDHSDRLHAVFTTTGIYSDSTNPEDRGGIRSLIWHWDEISREFSLVASRWVYALIPPGGDNLMAKRPTLAEDESTGYLYCAYMQMDTARYSVYLYPNSDIFISVSTDDGSHWSVGTNVTRTWPDVNPAPEGQSLAEREPTLAETVTDGYLHLAYMLDHDAGTSVFSSPEGVSTLNEFIYQRIPVDSIPTTPLMPQYPLHYDSAGFSGVSDHRTQTPLPSEFVLHPAYPNPFNNSTNIVFDLPRAMNIELKVFDILGRTAEVLQSGRLEAGAHVIAWDASRFASGVYFISLSDNAHSRVQKVLLLK